MAVIVFLVIVACCCKFMLYMLKVEARELGIRSQAELDSELKTVEATIKRIRNRMEGIEDVDEKVSTLTARNMFAGG